MAVVRVSPPYGKELNRDEDGHRNYQVFHDVETDNALDGPQIISGAAGLPQIGDQWAFGNDMDVWAFCWPNAKIRSVGGGPREATKRWRVEQLFTTRPFSRCQDTAIEDPLLEPQGIGGTFVKYTEEAQRDRFGALILSSSHEMLRGPQVEFDANRPTVRISQNVAVLGLAVFTPMVDDVNDRELWGLSARTVKLSNVSWDRKFHGLCDVYFTRILDFDINFKTFDRDLLDEGTKVLSGHWIEPTGTGSCGADSWQLVDICGSAPDKDNPQHFIRFKDRNGENIRAILDGNGLPANTTIRTGTGPGTGTSTTDDAGDIHVEKYEESNFFLLGIPADLETGV
jgi:hypothetical protein